MKIVGYVENKSELYKKNDTIVNLDIDIYKPLTSEEKRIMERIRKDTNIVQCIPLSDIDCFGTYEELSDENYKIIQDNGFVLNGKYEDGKCMYVRESTLL